MGVAEPFAIMSIPARDLTGRCWRFSVQLLAFVEAEQRRRVLSARVLDQVLRAGTAIGAHSAEADAAISRRHLLALRAGALKEALETEYWLHLIAEGRRCHSPEVLGELQAQLGQLTAILTVCVKKLRGQ
jgi:four helix bundle protein